MYVYIPLYIHISIYIYIYIYIANSDIIVTVSTSALISENIRIYIYIYTPLRPGPHASAQDDEGQIGWEAFCPVLALAQQAGQRQGRGPGANMHNRAAGKVLPSSK